MPKRCPVGLIRRVYVNGTVGPHVRRKDSVRLEVAECVAMETALVARSQTDVV